MLIRIPCTIKKDMTEKEAARMALEVYAESYENGDEKRYSPAVKLIGTYYVDYRYGEDSYKVYEFEAIENIQVNDIEIGPYSDVW